MSRRGYPQCDQELEPERLDSILGAAFSTGATRAPAGCQQLVSPVRAAAVQRASDLPVVDRRALELEVVEVLGDGSFSLASTSICLLFLSV